MRTPLSKLGPRPKSVSRQAAYLKKGCRLTLGMTGASSALPEQPFDGLLLKGSRIYRRSRELFLKQGGVHVAALLSSPRSLSSAGLLANRVEYSPIASEFVWAATDPAESRHSEWLLELRTIATSVYHEQNHRILWKLLPPAPLVTRGKPDALRRYLNFAEALVIGLDMAAGDELWESGSGFFYLSGVLYDPGTSVRKEQARDRRAYRNYLQAAIHATYLSLEFYSDQGISKALRRLFPGDAALAERACARSVRLDPRFIAITNREWQRRQFAAASAALTRKRGPVLELSDDPLDNREQYLWAERVFDLFGV